MNKDRKLLEEAYQLICESNVRTLYFGPNSQRNLWMHWLYARKHEVHPDGSVSMFEDASFKDMGLSVIPFKFKRAEGWFDCSNNNLTSLEGAPKEVGGDFYCGNNKLTSLEGAPEVIKGEFRSDQFSDADYRAFAKKRKYVDNKLDKNLDVDLGDFS